MNFALVTHSLPQPSTNGGPMTCWAVLSYMLRMGHQVTVYALTADGDPFNTAQRRTLLTDLGADIVQVSIPGYGSSGRLLGDDRSLKSIYRHLLKPKLATFFPSDLAVPQMRRLLELGKHDAAFVYHWEPLAATHGIRTTPRMAAVGDPWHLPSLRNWQQTRPRLNLSYFAHTFRTLRDFYHHPRMMVKLLNDCEDSGCFQSNAAAWLRGEGARSCSYLRSAIVDACGPNWQERRQSVPRGSKPTILLGPSNLEATSTSAGIRLFATEILPNLERELGTDGFLVRVVGEGKPPSELAKMLPRASVQLCGRVEPADCEFLSADIQLVPTPFELGIRLRIIVGFSFGCCVVAHTKEALNIPEMVHNENALLASDGPGLTNAIIHAVRDQGLRERLGANARLTYEHYFAPEKAAAPIVDKLERLALMKNAN